MSGLVCEKVYKEDFNFRISKVEKKLKYAKINNTLKTELNYRKRIYCIVLDVL